MTSQKQKANKEDKEERINQLIKEEDEAMGLYVGARNLLLLFVVTVYVFSGTAEAWSWSWGSDQSGSSWGWGWSSDNSGSGSSASGSGGSDSNSSGGSSWGWGWSSNGTDTNWGWGITSGSNHSSGTGSTHNSHHNHTAPSNHSSVNGSTHKNHTAPSNHSSGNGSISNNNHQNHTAPISSRRMIEVTVWKSDFDYQEWASKHAPFYVNDVLVVKYDHNEQTKSKHSNKKKNDVYLLPDLRSYKRCDVARGKKLVARRSSSKGFKLLLRKTLTYYLASGDQNSCNHNMKFSISPIPHHSSHTKP